VWASKWIEKRAARQRGFQDSSRHCRGVTVCFLPTYLPMFAPISQVDPIPKDLAAYSRLRLVQNSPDFWNAVSDGPSGTDPGKRLYRCLFSGRYARSKTHSNSSFQIQWSERPGESSSDPRTCMHMIPLIGRAKTRASPHLRRPPPGLSLIQE
jgi:hypothetical protein